MIPTSINRRRYFSKLVTLTASELQLVCGGSVSGACATCNKEFPYSDATYCRCRDPNLEHSYRYLRYVAKGLSYIGFRAVLFGATCTLSLIAIDWLLGNIAIWPIEDRPHQQ